MKIQKTIGILLIVGSVGVLIPYTILTITFNYPDILREDSGVILAEFNEGGSPLIFTWLLFALLGIPLLIAYSLIGQMLNSQSLNIRWVTSLGIISGVVQIIGLLRWVFVVPVLASSFVHTSDPATRESIALVFKVIHQFGGVLLGEHIGQLFTIAWTIYMSSILRKTGIISKWLARLGFMASGIYFLAQSELLATVIPDFPVFNLAGFIGSSLWLLWLIMIGMGFIKYKRTDTNWPAVS